jgi:type II secretory pathway pseudopilin PulG
VELLTVMIVIAILAGLILGTAGYIQKKGARARAEAEKAAFSSALENYKADNAVYPRDATTDQLDPATSGDPKNYKDASLFLYKELVGDRDADGATDSGARNYMGEGLTPRMLGRADASKPPSTSNPITFLQDPFGNSYGYSTAYQSWLEAGGSGQQKGFNPTFDLWSTAGQSGAPNPGNDNDPANQWIKNW